MPKPRFTTIESTSEAPVKSGVDDSHDFFVDSVRKDNAEIAAGDQ